MKKYLIPILIVILIGAGLYWFIKSSRNFPAFTSPSASAQNEPSLPPVTATLEIFALPVSVVLPGSIDKTDAVDKQKIAEGTKIITGETGRAQIVYANKSVTRMDFNTEITLKKLTASPVQVELMLTKKRIWNRVAKLLGNESYQTETGTTVATVRGTSYAHGILPDGRNRVITTKGVVDTHCLNDSQEATVSANAKILFDCKTGGKLPLLKLDEVIKDKDEWFEFNQKQDTALDERFGKETYGDEFAPSTTPIPNGSTNTVQTNTTGPTLEQCLERCYKLQDALAKNKCIRERTQGYNSTTIPKSEICF